MKVQSTLVETGIKLLQIQIKSNGWLWSSDCAHWLHILHKIGTIDHSLRAFSWNYHIKTSSKFYLARFTFWESILAQYNLPI